MPREKHIKPTHLFSSSHAFQEAFSMPPSHHIHIHAHGKSKISEKERSRIERYRIKIDDRRSNAAAQKKNVESPEKPRMSPETKRITQTPILVTPSHFVKIMFPSPPFPPLPITLRPIECPILIPNQTFLAPNNPKLSAQSFSPITGVGSGMISQFLKG